MDTEVIPLRKLIDLLQDHGVPADACLPRGDDSMRFIVTGDRLIVGQVPTHAMLMVLHTFKFTEQTVEWFKAWLIDPDAVIQRTALTYGGRVQAAGTIAGEKVQSWISKDFNITQVPVKFLLQVPLAIPPDGFKAMRKRRVVAV